jgi:hypothetical protein
MRFWRRTPFTVAVRPWRDRAMSQPKRVTTSQSASGASSSALNIRRRIRNHGAFPRHTTLCTAWVGGGSYRLDRFERLAFSRAVLRRVPPVGTTPVNSLTSTSFTLNSMQRNPFVPDYRNHFQIAPESLHITSKSGNQVIIPFFKTG